MHKPMNKNLLLEKIKKEARKCLANRLNDAMLRSLAFLSLVYQNIKIERCQNKRGIYYEAVDIFKSQSLVDSLISKYTRILECSSDDLMLKASPKGLFRGDLVFVYRKGDYVDRRELSGKNLIPDMADVAGVEYRADIILVIEKDTIFSLVNPKDAIVVCGKGYPCMNTIKLLLHLRNAKRLLCMTDFDPHGLHIYEVYKRNIPEIQRLGLCSADIFKYTIKKEQCIAFSKYDGKLLEKLVKCESTKEEAEFMMGLGFKLELEAVVGREDFQIDAYLEQVNDT